MDRKSIFIPNERYSRQVLLYITILVLVPTAIVIIAAEGYVRITRSYIDLWAVTGRRIGRNPIEKWALVDAFSAYKGRPGNYGKKRKSINKHVFISTPDISISKPENTLRIVFLGGSATAGTAVTG